jgi:hypothetical protein
LGNPAAPAENLKYSLESFFSAEIESRNISSKMNAKDKDGKDLDLGVEVYDNFQYLKLAELKRKITEDRAEDIITKRTIGMEGIYVDRDDEGLKIESSFYRRKPTNQEAIIRIDEIKPGDRPTVGNPLTMKLPSESCIPVHVPGNPRDHLGYFIIMDEMGNPINDATSSDYYRQMGYNLYNNNSQVSSQLLGQTAMATNGVSPEMTKMKFQEAVATYTNIVEKDLLTRLKNGIYGDNVEINKSSEIYRIMLSRTLVNKRTQLLFIPKQLLVYFAFDYNDDGVGISLTEKSKVIASIRSILLFSNTMASIKNSIGRTQAAITLDPKDRDPVATVEYMLHEFARHRRSAFPFGVYNPTDLVSYLCNAGVEVAVSGNSGYPETKFEVNSSTNTVSKPDTELEDSMKKRHIQSFGIAPETVDLSMGVDFATSIVSSNLLLSKRVLMYQEIFTELLEEFINKYVMNSGTLITELKGVIVNNKDKLQTKFPDVAPMDIIKQFMKTLKITLPAPDSVTLDNQMLAFDKYVEALDKALAAYFSTEFLDATVLGDMSNVIEPTKAALKAYFLRKWLAENNVLPELGEITMMSDDDEENFNLLNVMDAHVEGLTKSLKEYMDKIKARVDANAPADPYGATTPPAADQYGSPTPEPATDTSNPEAPLDEEGPSIDEEPKEPAKDEKVPEEPKAETPPKEETPKEEKKPEETTIGSVPKAEPATP